MNLEELTDYSMKGKTFTIVDKQGKKKTISIGSDYPFTIKEVELIDSNLCSSFITVFKDDSPHYKSIYYEVSHYDIEEILYSKNSIAVIIYSCNIGGQRWLEASRLEDILDDSSEVFIPDIQLKSVLKEIKRINSKS